MGTYNIEFKIKKELGFIALDSVKYFDFIPRVNDVILIDELYYKVLCVEFDYASHRKVMIYLDILGDYTEYKKNHLSKL